MNSFLQSQIEGRTANINQISQMSNTEKGGHFDEWKERVANDYQGKLEDYANELNRDRAYWMERIYTELWKNNN